MSLTALTDSRVPFGMSPAWQGLNADLPARLHDLPVPVQPTQLEFLVMFLVGLSQESNKGPHFSD